MTFLVPLAGVSRVRRAFASAANTAGSAPSHTFTGAALGDADPSRIIVLFICVQQNAGTITCSIGGVSATQFATVDNSTRRARGFAAAVPTGATGDIVISTTAGAASFYSYAAYALYGAASITPHDFEAKTSAPPSLSFDVPANGAGLAAIFDASTASATWSGLTEDFDANDGSVFTTCASDEFIAAQTPLAASATLTATVAVTYIGASFGP